MMPTLCGNWPGSSNGGYNWKKCLHDGTPLLSGESFFTFLKVIPEDLRNSRYVKSSSGGLHMVISGMTSASQQATSSITQIWSWKQQYKTPSMSLLLNVFQATAVLGLDRIRSVQMIRILTRVNCCLHGKHHCMQPIMTFNLILWRYIKLHSW